MPRSIVTYRKKIEKREREEKGVKEVVYMLESQWPSVSASLRCRKKPTLTPSVYNGSDTCTTPLTQVTYSTCMFSFLMTTQSCTTMSPPLAIKAEKKL